MNYQNCLIRVFFRKMFLGKNDGAHLVSIEDCRTMDASKEMLFKNAIFVPRDADTTWVSSLEYFSAAHRLTSHYAQDFRVRVLVALEIAGRFLQDYNYNVNPGDSAQLEECLE